VLEDCFIPLIYREKLKEISICHDAKFEITDDFFNEIVKKLLEFKKFTAISLLFPYNESIKEQSVTNALKGFAELKLLKSLTISMMNSRNLNVGIIAKN